MNNRIGLGVFGTFGDPHGYQQEFYFDVRFVNSLDLNEFAIEFYPGADLYSVKREIIDGVYTVCFCIYTYARELNTERFGTFIGSCIVLQDSYTDADYVYQSLKELHKSILSNPAYLKGNTINVATAKDISVTEPADFVAARANAIPISKTPFFTPYVDPQKNYLVLPYADTTDAIDAQVLRFFDEAQKYHTDTTTLYFSTDSNVADFVKQEDILEVQDWQTFCSRKQEAPKTAVVRTKKGVHRPANFSDEITATADSGISAPSYTSTDRDDTPAIGTAIVEPKIDSAHQPYLPKNSESYLVDDDDDPYKPFDLWDEPIPETGWNKQETTYRVKEYNRLFRYTNVLLEHIHQPSANGSDGMSKKKKLIITLLVLLLISTGVAVYILFFHDKQNSTPPKFKSGAKTEKVKDTTSSEPRTPNADKKKVSDAEPVEELTEETAPKKNSAVKDAPQPTQTVVPTATTNSKQTEAKEEKSTNISPSSALETAETGRGAMYVPGKEVPSPSTSVSMIPGDLKPKTLHPRPNTQLTQNDIPALKEAGVKDKTLTELIKILFESSPQNIGYIYKGQEQQYGALLISNNKIFFKRTTNDYICTADQQLLHIPAYNSPRLPAVFPK